MAIIASCVLSLLFTSDTVCCVLVRVVQGLPEGWLLEARFLHIVADVLDQKRLQTFFLPSCDSCTRPPSAKP